jgi:hypothetical protein
MEIPAELKQQVTEMMTWIVERDDKTIGDLLPRIQHVAKWIENHCQGDAKKIKAIEKRLRIEFAPLLSVRFARDVTDEQRAKLLSFAGSDRVLDLCKIIVEIEKANKGGN